MMKYELLLNYWNINGFKISGNEDIYENIYKEILNLNTLNSNIINDFINHLKNNNNNNSFVYKTMRMSLYQL